MILVAFVSKSLLKLPYSEKKENKIKPQHTNVHNFLLTFFTNRVFTTFHIF